MAKQHEARFKAKIVKILKEEPNVFVICPSDAVTRGISDLLICFKGRFVAIELKIDTPISELQQTFLANVALATGLAMALRLIPEDKVCEASWFGGLRRLGHPQELIPLLKELTA